MKSQIIQELKSTVETYDENENIFTTIVVDHIDEDSPYMFGIAIAGEWREKMAQ